MADQTNETTPAAPLTPQERFDQAQLVQYDLNAVANIKLGLAANNAGVGIIRILYSSDLKIRPETAAALNVSIMAAINGQLDDLTTELTTEFNTTMNNPVTE